MCRVATRHYLTLPDTQKGIHMEATITKTIEITTREVEISGFRFPYQRWLHGQRMTGRLIAIDTETEIIKDPEVPPLALAIASDGRQHVLIHPDDVGEFLLTHSQAEFVCHNVAFDFWVIHEHLTETGEVDALKFWVHLVKAHRLHDTMLLDILLRLARGAGGIEKRDLAIVTRFYTGLEISKEDQYRLRFGELIDCDWETAEPGFFQYAIKDAICTLLVYQIMRSQAVEAMTAQGRRSAPKGPIEIYPDAPARFGLLSEAIQVEGAIALAATTRNGLHTHAERLKTAKEEFQQELESVIDEFITHYPGILLQDTTGQLRLTKSGLPRKSHVNLDKSLLAAVDEICQRTGTTVTAKSTPKGKISHSVGEWKDLIDQSAFLSLWASYERLTKKKQFFEALSEPVLHPRYQVLIRTGRTSCSKPNMQNIPRDGEFRNVIVPSPGHLLLVVDYSFIELVTLAAVCQARFGSSRLADVIKKGVDPHCYTAAILAGISLKQFMSLKHTDPARFKSARQQAKPVNFGVPGGMGPTALVAYAKATYGVQMTQQEAEDFHHRLTTKIYPELGQYLAGDGLFQLARWLKVPEAVCIKSFCFGDLTPSIAAAIVRKIVKGQPLKKDGTPFKPSYVRGVWDSLIAINRNERLGTELQRRVGSPRLADRLFPSSVATLTGRIRGNVSYTQARNTPFQSLASDGAKRALGRLVLGGYRVVGFVHDEVLIELPDQGDYVDRSAVEAVVTIMIESMQEMTGDVPVKCEYTVSDRWSKNAELIPDGEKVRAWRPTIKGDTVPPSV